MKKTILLSTVLLAGIAITIFTACSKDKLVNDIGNGDPGQVITMKGGVYSPADITLTPGARITWINDDNITHTVTSDNGLFSSGDIQAGGRYTVQLDSIGSYRYSCIYHPGMTGVIQIVIR